MKRSKLWLLITLLTVVALVLAACGGGEEEDAGVVEDEAGEVIEEEPLEEEAEVVEEEPVEEDVEVVEEEPVEEDLEVVEEEEPLEEDIEVEGEEPEVEVEEGAAAEGTITWLAGDTQADIDRARDYIQPWLEEHPGVEVEILQGPQSATERLGLYLQDFEAQRGDYDLMQIDVIWPGDLAEHLIDLTPYVDPEVLAQYFPSIVENNTVDGKLVGIPWFTDGGILYYRTDLLEEYGYDGPPETWEELEEMALTIQEGERAENPDFTGYVWQGDAYEGLTCDALEWIASSGGGTIVSPEGVVTIDNPEAAEALEMAANWIGTISPTGVTGFKEEDSRAVWHAGNAAFMRNWPYAYSLTAEDSPIAEDFDVAPLPRAEDSETGAACLGGWQLGVSAYSDNPDLAGDLAAYLTSPEIQKRQAIEASLIPTIASLYEDPEVLEAQPFMAIMPDVLANATPRPSTATAPNYNEVSTIFFSNVHSVLTGQMDAEDAVVNMSIEISDLTGLPEGEPE